MGRTVTAVVHPTTDRTTARGEFIIRLSADAMRAIDAREGQHVVVRAEPAKPIPGAAGELFRALAAVRRLRKDDEEAWSKPTPARPVPEQHVRMDETLRQAIGVGNEGETLLPWRITVERAAVDPGRDLWARCLGFQYVVCRVQKAFSGDAETPMCRTTPAVIQSLGLAHQVVAVVVSPQSEVRVRLLPLPEGRRMRRELITTSTKQSETGSLVDYDRYLMGDKVDRGWRLPDIHIDLETRELLGVVPGQVVWVRREPFSLLKERLPLIISPIVLAVLARLIENDKWSEVLSMNTLIAGFVAALVLLLIAVCEIRGQVTRSTLLRDDR